MGRVVVARGATLASLCERKIKNVGLELSFNKNEQRRDTHLGISRRHEVHDVPVWLALGDENGLEPLAEVEGALLVVEVLHAPHPELLGLLLVGGEHYSCTRPNSFQKASRTGPTKATHTPDCMIAQEAGGTSTSSTSTTTSYLPAPLHSLAHSTRAARLQSKTGLMECTKGLSSDDRRTSRCHHLFVFKQRHLVRRMLHKNRKNNTSTRYRTNAKSQSSGARHGMA